MANNALPFIQQAGDAAGEGIDIWHYLQVLNARKWSILTLGILFAIWAGLATMSQKPIYTATLTLLLEAEDSPALSMQDFYRSMPRSYEFTETEFGIIRSRQLAEKVVRAAQLHKHPYFNKPPTTKKKFDLSFFKPSAASASGPQRKPLTEEEKIKSLIGYVSSGVRVASDDSRIIEISFVSRDPDIAVLIANTLAEVYIDDHLQAELDATRRATQWLTTRLQDLKVNLNESEARLQAFRDTEQLIDIQGGVIAIGARELDDLTARLSEAKAKRIAAESIYNETLSRKNLNADYLMTIPAVMNYGSIRDYSQANAALEREVAELAKRYGPKHPKMIALRSKQAQALKTLRAEIRNVVSGIARDYEVAKRSEERLAAELAASKTDLQSINRKEFKLAELQREVDTNRQLYDMFFQRIRETADASGFAKAHARVLDPAEFAEGSQASKVRAIIIALFLGLFLGVGLAILMDFLDDTINTPLQVQEKLKAPFLGIVPLIKTDKAGGGFTHYWEATQSVFAESIRTIRTGIILDSLDDPFKVILITSTLPGEGKSTLALSLGAAMGQMENVLVIGADLRRPTIAERVDLPKGQPGISDYLSGQAALNDCLVKLPDAGFHLLPAGMVPPHPLELLSSKKFKETLDFLKTKFDRIIIDSAPTQAVSDALVLASYADAVIYVVKAGKTSDRLVKQGLERLRNAADNIDDADVVLNYFDNTKAARYASGGYYYQHYYSSKS